MTRRRRALGQARKPSLPPCIKPLLLGLMLLISCGTGSAEIPEDVARELIRVSTPYKGWQIEKVRLEGVPTDLKRELRQGLMLYGTPRLAGLLGRKRPALTPSLLIQDANRIQLFLARQGYPQVRLGARIETIGLRKQARLTIKVDAGPPVRIRQVELTGLEVSPDPAKLERTLRDLLPQPGDVFEDDKFTEGSLRLVRELRADGHALATCTESFELLDSVTVVPAYKMNPGPVCLIGAVTATGVKPDLTRLAERTLKLMLGDIATPKLLTEAQERLRLLGVFRQIRFTLDRPADTVEVKKLDLVLHAELAPRTPQVLEVGAGWWTAEGARVSGRWSHANLFLGGRGLQLSGSASRVRQTGRVESWWPAMINPTLRGEVALILDRQSEESFGLLSREVRLGLRQRPTLWLTLAGGVAVSEVLVDPQSVDSLAFLAASGRQTVFNATGLRNDTDNPLDPHRGTQNSVQVEWTVPGFFNNADFVRTDLESVAYRELGPVVAAVRLRLGAAWPLGASRDLLPNRRFFAGGMDHRGFGRNQLGPRDAAGLPIGGEALALGTVEVRHPLVWKLGAALFLDVGQVWADPAVVRARDLEFAAGPALLLQTPVGPLRMDLGWRLGMVDGQDRWALHVAIGHPF